MNPLSYVPGRGLALLVLLVGLLATACAGVRPGGEPPVPTPVITPVASNRPVYTVERGTISQMLKGSARVGSRQEATLFFTRSARLQRLYVESGKTVQEGDLLAELDTAELRKKINEQLIQVGIAELRLAQLVDTSGSQTNLANAAAALARAQADYRKALNELEKVQAGPTVVDIATAEQRVAAERASLARAESALARLVAGPLPEELSAAESTLREKAQSQTEAQWRRDAACATDLTFGPCQVAEVRLAAAREDHERARLRLERLRAGPAPEERAAAEQAVASARAAVATAEARLAEVRAGPTAATVAFTQKSVESARAAIDAAQANYDRQIALNARGEALDIQIQRKQVELVRLTLQSLEDELAGSLIKAPFAGLILQTSGREGEVVQAFRPVVVIAKPDQLVIRFDVAPGDLNKIAPGQPATIVLSALPTEQFKGQVIQAPTLMSGAGLPGFSDKINRSVIIGFLDRPPPNIEIGSLANVSVAVQRKEDVLLVPTMVIRTQAGRRFVRLAEEGRRLPEVDIEVGISDEFYTEVLRGLTEGQRVVQP